MACTLVQSTNIDAAASVYVKSHNSKQRGVSGVANVRMLCDSSDRMRGGLRISAPGFSAVDKFHSKVAISVSAPRIRGSRCAARAMSSLDDRFAGERIIADDLDEFTDEGFEVIKLAHKEARRMGHNYVGTEQILLGIIAQGTGIAAEVLKSMGICLKDARVEVEKIIGKGNVPVEEIPIFLPVLEHSTHVFRHTIDVAGRKIRPEHWMLGLLSDDECVAVRVLKNLGADPNNIRTQVIQTIGENTEAA